MFVGTVNPLGTVPLSVQTGVGEMPNPGILQPRLMEDATPLLRSICPLPLVRLVTPVTSIIPDKVGQLGPPLLVSMVTRETAGD